MAYRRPVNMTAKRAGECANCSHGIRPGEPITWQPMGAAWHRDCRAAAYARSEKAERARADRQCHKCDRHDATLYSPGPYTVVACPPCWQAWLDANDFYRQLTNRGPATNEDVGACDDRAYEDQCARQCGLA